MKVPYFIVSTLLLQLCRSSGIFAQIADAINDKWQNIWCWRRDCCNSYWIPENITELQRSLKDEVFGQHIAVDIAFKQVRAHLSNDNPVKPLVMSFHGQTGNGKNHVAYLIARSLYRTGPNSPFYHHFMATVHFPHRSMGPVYQDQLRTWVKGNVSDCGRSLFVFDEVDKMPENVLDGIRAYLDYIDRVDNVDYRKSIFIFLSNTGGQNITVKVHEAWKNGRKRDDLTLRDFEQLVARGAFIEEGGLFMSHLIEKSLIDVYVPFLPMEKVHVRQCAENEFRKQKYVPGNKDAALQKIVDSLNYYPGDTELYSTTGCKRVAQKVSLHIASEKYFDMDLHDSGRKRKMEL